MLQSESPVLTNSRGLKVDPTSLAERTLARHGALTRTPIA